MGMVVQHNMNALNAYNKLNANVTGLRKASEKLSSGYRINRAGDDAAGLAISEKMRSQIRGLNQAVRNSQDGINMIQTFEGAAQETHSILQRMKELASESANGTYDNATDRAAIQLEFEQLNDELNQIADTDFNGTVVLNGGEMADGLKQVDGNFDYRLKAGQVADKNAAALADAQSKAQSKIDAAQKAFDSAKAVYDNTKNRDLCLNGDAVQWNSVDDNQYTAAAAKALFDGINYTDAAGGTGTLTANGIESIDVTYTFDGTNWNITGGTYLDKSGAEQDADVDEIKAVISTVTKTANGGFIAGTAAATPGSSDKAVYGNAIFNSTEAKTGDVVTLTYTNKASLSKAPTNIGMDEESLKNSVKGTADPKLELLIKNDSEMTDEVAAALDKLNKAEVEFAYAGETITSTISDDSLQIAAGDTDGEYIISFVNSDKQTVELAKVTVSVGSGPAAATTNYNATTTTTPSTDANTWNTAGAETLTFSADGKWVAADGTEYDDLTSIAVGYTDSTGTAATQNVAITVAGGSDYQAGDKITIGIAAAGNAHDITVNYTGQPKSEGTVGSIKFGVALDHGNYDISNTRPTIDPGRSKDGVDSRTIDKNYETTKAALDEAKAAYPKTVDDLGDMGGVTKADAFDNSTARMTYTDNLTLQTGARTKDAVNFTFKYNTDGTADMGDLKANLNLSAREDGLNTANLSLANQDDANYAIDQIDKAINKTSMVRATFGAIQNRLEHKITNLTTTSENLQEAESSIRDTDMASEMMNYTKFNILQQAAQSMLAQANQQPQSILQLLG